MNRLHSPLFLIPLLALSACDSGASKTPPGMGATPNVTVAAVEERMIPDELSFVARVAAKDRVDIRAQVSGILIEQKFEDGADVKKGDLLFVIEPDEYETALASAEAEVASAVAQQDNAERYYKRLKTVGSTGVSATEIEQAEIDTRIATAAVDRAVATRSTAELNLKRTRIYAPIDGQIGKAMVDAGNLVDASTGTLATIVQVDPIRVKHSLSEKFFTEETEQLVDRDPSLPPIRDTLIPRIVLSTGQHYAHDGKIVFLDNEIASTTGTIQAEAEFSNPDGILKPGQFVDLLVQRGEPVKRLTVPQSAIQQDQQGHFALVVDEEGNVMQRRITTGDRIGVDWTVEEGLNANEKVIIQGIEKVRPGSKVNALEFTDQAPSQTEAPEEKTAEGKTAPSTSPQANPEPAPAGDA
ncbi:MAG: efflux RND transporter periplasmic adaptor subunit [Verrucomicrobiales bacterium]|nr:efflux RND transporter periplasmic adaptor subunit [Verrucomicrobiales bacterium]